MKTLANMSKRDYLKIKGQIKKDTRNKIENGLLVANWYNPAENLRRKPEITPADY